MKNLILLITIACLSQITNAQPGSPRISMGETPGINLFNSELKGPVKEIIEFEYYKKLNEPNIDTSKVTIKTVMKFDQKGNETEELKYGHTGKLLSRCIYDYSTPKLVVVKKFIQDTLLLGKYIFTCDDSGKLMELKIFPGKYNVAFRTVYKYNNKGCNDTIITYAGEYAVSRNVVEYNNRNQKVSNKSYDFRRTLTNSLSISYDDKGNIIEKGNLDVPPIIQVSSLTKRTKTDEHGNWKLTTEEDDGFSDNIELKKIVKRVILYY